jgi:Kef-type K+ transport system membrane component KefB
MHDIAVLALKSEGLKNTPAATGIMTSTVLDDIASLVLAAILVPITTGETTVSMDGILLILGKAVAFFALVTVIGA